MQRESPSRVKAPNTKPQATDSQARAEAHTQEGKEKGARSETKDAKDQWRQTLPIRQVTRPGRVKHKDNKLDWHDSLRYRAGRANSCRQPRKHKGSALVA